MVLYISLYRGYIILYILIGHTLLEDLVGETYGNKIYYAEVIEMAGENCSNF